MKHVNILIAGKVQGVFFRASANELARHLGLRGFVRNQLDGNVYIEAEGEDPQLSKFIAWCRKGPPRAHVENVELTESGMKNFATFEIIR